MSSHGTRSRYVSGCRCDKCRRANSRYQKRNNALGTDLIDATPVREHIAMLRAAGIGRREIHRRSGVAQSVIARLAGVDTSRPATRVRPETAAAILALPAISPHLMDATGTRRRMRALMAIGWSQAAQARILGMSIGTVSLLVGGDHELVLRSTAERVRAMYEQIGDADGGSVRARNHARAQGWPPPAAWDDIDTDTDEHARAATRTGREPITDADLAEIVHRLDNGGTVDAVAAEYGVSGRHLQRTMRKVAS